MRNDLDLMISVVEEKILQNFKESHCSLDELERLCARLGAQLFKAQGLLHYTVAKGLGSSSKEALEALERAPETEKVNFMRGFDVGIRLRNSKVASRGGAAKAQSLIELEAATIAAYERGNNGKPWSKPTVAALAITPEIVQLSRDIAKKNGKKGALADTTSKPLEWIRNHIRKQNAVASKQNGVFA